MKGEGRNCELAECAMRRGVSVRAYEAAEEETANGRGGKKRASFPPKMGMKGKLCFIKRKNKNLVSNGRIFCEKNVSFF